MKITPRIIACSLIDAVETSPESADQACDAAISLLKTHCPSVTLRDFLKAAEKEMKKRGRLSSGLLVVPNDHSVKAETIAAQLKAKSGKDVVIDRKIDPDLIGGAVVLVDHQRIDCSIQGALQSLLAMCLQPID